MDPLYTVSSIENVVTARTALVRLWPDRIERRLAPRRFDPRRSDLWHESVPLRSVAHVEIKRNSLLSEVTVVSAGMPIRYTLRPGQAIEFKHAVMAAIVALNQPKPESGEINLRPEVDLRTAPGWFPDPNEPSHMRYFDGRSWTQHVARPEHATETTSNS
jgi:hypothetical protein